MSAAMKSSESTPFIQALEEALVAPRQKFMGGKLIRHVMGGTVTLPLYKALLKETYHFVRHTPIHLRLAAARMSSEGEEGQLRERFLRHAKEESGHDLWALRDLEALGEDISAVKASHPLPFTAALIAYEHYTVSQQNPKSILGLEFAMEGLTAKAGGAAVQAIQAKLGIPDNAVTFFLKHAQLDAHHIEDDIKVISRFIDTEADRADVLRNAVDSTILYAAMYDGLCESVGL